MAETQRLSANPLTRRQFLRLAGLGVVLALAGGAFLYLCWKVPRPFLIQRQQQAELATLQRQLAARTGEHGALAAEMGALSTPEGMRLEARRLGYVRPGERPLRFLTPPPPPARPQVGPPPPPPLSVQLHRGTHAALDRVQRALIRFIHGG